MALIRIARMLAALLLVAVAAPAGGATVRSAPMAGPPAPVVAVAPPVAAGMAGTASVPLAATDDDEDNNPQTIPAEDLLAPDGTLRLDGTFNGAVDISGWDVTLDPNNGPIFSSQALTYTWENLGTGVEGLLKGTVTTIAISDTDVYIGGFFFDAGGVTGANYLARWDGAQWHAVGGANAINKRVTTIAISGTDVYVGGEFTDAGGNSAADYLARWDGAQWHAVGGANAISAPVNAIAISGAEVYVGGFFFDAGGVSGANYIARWDGTQWSGLLSGTVGLNRPVNTIAISGTDVYVGGFFLSAGGVTGANRIARWNGTSWNRVGGPNAISGFFSTVNTIAISGTDVYVGGEFTNAGNVPGANCIARWNGTSWSGLLSGTFGISNTVRTIAISGTDVYVGGEFTNAGGVPGANSIARWNSANNTWNLVGGANAISGSFPDTIVRTIAISGTDVYVGGDFTDAGGNSAADYLARWDGTQWHAVGGANAISAPVYTIAISGTDVYVGGRFTNAGGISGANNIARWDGTNWNAVGGANAIIGFSTVSAIVVSGNDVYIGGEFTNVGGNSAIDYLARWDGVQWTALVRGTAGVFGPVYALAVPSSDEVYAGGAFINAGNNPFADYIARYALATKRVYLPLITR